MAEDLRTGVHRNPGRHPEWFTTAYFHHPQDLAAEVAEAGLLPGPVLSVEGMLHWAPNIAARLADPTQRQLVLDFLAATETDETAYAATAHLSRLARPDHHCGPRATRVAAWSDATRLQRQLRARHRTHLLESDVAWGVLFAS